MKIRWKTLALISFKEKEEEKKKENNGGKQEGTHKSVLNLAFTHAQDWKYTKGKRLSQSNSRNWVFFYQKTWRTSLKADDFIISIYCHSISE